MKILAGIPVVLCLLVAAPRAGAQAIVADHTSTDVAAIPDAAVAGAAALRLLVRHASVGGNIDSGLEALRTANARYDRSLWDFQSRGNPGWQAKVDDLVAQAALQGASFDVLTMKFCYIDPNASFTYYRDALLGLEQDYPTKRFVWWTIPIETTGNTNRQAFNDLVRAYAAANGKVLFDIADVESHDAAGVKRVDGSGRELMRDEWTSDGGHLNAAGSQRVASALWWLMARVAGWSPTAEPLAFHPLAPCRVVDTRDAPDPYGGPALSAGETRPFAIAGRCGVPADAGAVALNVTVANPTFEGSLTLYPGTGAVPGTSTVSFPAGRIRANNAIIGLSEGTLSVFDGQPAGTTDLVVDVSGYFR
jgi:hypothetical protein